MLISKRVNKWNDKLENAKKTWLASSSGLVGKAENQYVKGSNPTIVKVFYCTNH